MRNFMLYINTKLIAKSTKVQERMKKMKIFGKKTAVIILALALIISSSIGVFADEIIARKRSSGSVVTQIQQRLANLGYSGPVNGKFGKATESQVMAFQAANSLTVDGVVRQSVYNKIFSSSAVKASDVHSSDSSGLAGNGIQTPKGTIIARLKSKGNIVTGIQQRLVSLGYSTPVDGVFGKSTKAAVEAFQSANSLYVDGIVTQSVYNALFSGSSKKGGGSSSSSSNGSVIARKNSKGSIVLNIQHQLKKLGFTVNTDGSFTKETKSAVQAFQVANGLVADGVVYQSTLNLLFSGKAKGNTGSGNSGSSSGTIIARKNSRGSVVLKIQQRLNALGYACKIDGIYGKGTANAVMLLQMNNGLPVNGIVRNAEYSLLTSGVTPPKSSTPKISGPKTPSGNIIARKNSTGVVVQGIQLKLNALGFSCNVDGKFTDKTVKAVKAFQKANGLIVDGIVRQSVYDVLFSSGAISYPNAHKGTPSNGAVIAKRGSKGIVVLQIQQRLIALGYKLTADGIYGKGTTSAVRAFQIKNSIYPDGIVKQSVYTLLFSTKAK